jgi:hypothetical protein
MPVQVSDRLRRSGKEHLHRQDIVFGRHVKDESCVPVEIDLGNIRVAAQRRLSRRIMLSLRDAFVGRDRCRP